MSIADIAKIVAANATVFAALQACATFWLKTRLENSIRHEYEKRLKDYQRTLDLRDRAAMVAELFAEWSAPVADVKRLNQLAWEASLWLPAEVVRDLASRLTNESGAPDVKDILVSVRQHLHSAFDGTGSSGSITRNDIVHFPANPTKPSVGAGGPAPALPGAPVG